MPGARRTARRTVSFVVVAGLATLAGGCGTAASHGSTSPAPGGPATTGGGSTTGGGGGGAGGVGAHVPPRDSFEGSIRSATGSYSGYTGRARIYLVPRGNLRRSVTIVLEGLRCMAASRCLQLSGTATGALIPAPVHTPDVGRGELVRAAGTIHPIGHATIQGEVRGTGFIERGREVLALTLASSSATVRLQATSPVVHGFTSP